MKDNFSIGSEAYAQFRPHYPPELFAFLLSLVKNKNTAWDCGTGNGQVAGVLAGDFENVFATDISQSQLDAAIQKNNIHYSVQPAEKTSFQNNQFDLITVAQAIHWFDFDSFYNEVKRTTKKDGVFAVIGYGFFQTEKELQTIIDNFYTDTVGPYWDAERKYIDENYQTIPFPFNEIKTPSFDIQYEWEFDQLIGYINTWSAVKHYIKKNQSNPVDLIYHKLKQTWGLREKISFRFPILLRCTVL